MVAKGKTKFEDSIALEKKLKNAAEIAITDVLGVKPEEKVLIITNPDKDVQLISTLSIHAVSGLDIPSLMNLNLKFGVK